MNDIYELEDLMSVLNQVPSYLDDGECEGIRDNIVQFNSAGTSYIANGNKTMISSLENQMSNILAKSEECSPDSKYQTVNLIFIDSVEAFRAHSVGDQDKVNECVAAVLKLFSKLRA